MRISEDRPARLIPRSVLPALLAVAIVWVGGFLALVEPAQGADVVAVEEDWELVVKAPDEVTQAPQVSCIIAPSDEDGAVFAAFNLNHKSFPQYEAGGLHLQLWREDTPLASAAHNDDSLLNLPDEVVRWTTRMHLQEGRLWFEIAAGSSATWGDFGGTGALKASVASELQNLNHYDRNDSVANSGIGFAGNRVTSLRLQAVRKLLDSGDVLIDNQAQTVYPHD